MMVAVIHGSSIRSMRAGSGMSAGLCISIIVPSAIAAAVIARPPVADVPPGPAPDDPSWELWNPWLARERDDADPEDGDEA